MATSPAADPAGIEGVWRLVSRIDVDSDGNRKIDPILGADPLGVLAFEAGYFAAQFMKRDRSDAPLVAAGAGANNTAAVGGYDAYFGSYTFDPAAAQLTTTLDGSISPANVGKTFTRQCRVTATELTIQLATTATDGTPVTRTLRFRRARTG